MGLKVLTSPNNKIPSFSLIETYFLIVKEWTEREGGVSETNQAFEKYSLPIFLLIKSIFLV